HVVRAVHGHHIHLPSFCSASAVALRFASFGFIIQFSFFALPSRRSDRFAHALSSEDNQSSSSADTLTLSELLRTLEVKYAKTFVKFKHRRCVEFKKLCCAAAIILQTS
ncbi:hypothetical protein IJ531_07145, partial [bacterium]|nr:hypothetical protein [bacterium]